MRERPAGTATFLFTDIEGSTRLWEQHPDEMRDALARHDAIVRDAVERHGGHVFKTTGDGVNAVLAAAPDAIAAAADTLRALSAVAWETTGPLLVRMGIHTGSAEERDGDYFGPALNLASRLMSAAHGGQVVLSDATTALVYDTLPTGLGLLDLGEHRLRGLARPERVYQLTIAGLRSQFPPLQSLEASPGRPPLPVPAFARSDEELAGRGAELDRLEGAWKRAGDGTRQVALVAGEPGIGKTRLAGELSRRAYAQGGLVLYGRCDEEAVVPYQPFVEALRPYVAACPPSTLHERLHGLEQDLARLFPELLGRIADLSAWSPSDPETERYRLFEGFTALLTGAAATQPALLVLDDLQWAERPTLLLLRHIVRSSPFAALLIVACYRDVELAREDAVADLLADLRREAFVVSLTLHGLSETESGALLRGLAGHEVAPPLTGALHRGTGGNPFFLAELLCHLKETDAVPLEPGAAHEWDLGTLDLPEGVRDLVGRRLRRLPRPVNDVLTVAATVGPEFDAAFLERAAERPAGDVLESLDQARDAGLVREHSGRMHRYAFSHDLIRQTLYRQLGTAQRAQLHARVGVAMEKEAGSAQRAGTLAHHFTQAVPLGEAPKAIEYSTKAGHEAVADLAFEDAAAYFERALRLLEQYAPADTTQRVELLTDLADALVYVDERAGEDAALRAVDAARANRSPRQFGRAVAVFAEPARDVFAYPADVASLFDEARAALGDGHPALRARLLALEAFKYASYQLHGRDGRALAEEALGLARDTGEPHTLADALLALAVTLEGKPGLADRVALGDELVELGRSAGGRAATATAYGLRVLAGTHLELGDAEALDSTITELDRFGNELRWLPALAYAAQWRATRALLEARFDDVRACWKKMREYAPAYRGAAGIYATQVFYLAREEGELGSTAAPLERVAEERPENVYLQAMLALAQLDSGDETAALRNLDLLAADDFHRGDPGTAWPAVLGLLAEVAASTGAAGHAAALYTLLNPFAGRLLPAHMGLACLGASDRYLGMLSTVLERWEEAEAHFERGLAIEQRIRGRALLPRTRYWRARSLRARDRPGDHRAAHTMLEGVAEEASQLGMRRLGERAVELSAS